MTCVAVACDPPDLIKLRAAWIAAKAARKAHAPQRGGRWIVLMRAEGRDGEAYFRAYDAATEQERGRLASHLRALRSHP